MRTHYAQVPCEVVYILFHIHNNAMILVIVGFTDAKTKYDPRRQKLIAKLGLKLKAHDFPPISDIWNWEK